LSNALEYYKRAVDMGDNLAKNYLGAYYFNHTKEYNKAVKLFREAVEGGCERALNNLGICFEEGFGDAIQDYHQAIKLYEMSAE
jgi:TPR repeat protein